MQQDFIYCLEILVVFKFEEPNYIVVCVNDIKIKICSRKMLVCS